MKKLLGWVCAALVACCSAALAADNAVIMTPGTGVTFRSVDIGGGVQSMVHILGSSTGAAIYGTAGTANANVLSVQGIASGTVLPVSLTSTTITGTVAATQSGTWTVQPGNTANSTAWLVTGTGGTFPVTATNLSTNVAQINGVTPLMGNGTTGTGSLRVTVASDNTAFTVNAAQSGTWNVTNVSGTVSLPTGASTAAKQPALGTAGAASADVITIQGIASMTKLLVTPDSVALPANQSVNVAQINGVTPLMGNGASGTGAQRVSVSNDSTAIAGWGHVATGAAPPTGSTYIGANTSGATGGLVQGLIQCDSTAVYDASTTGSTEMVALTAGRTIYVCGYTITVGGTATNVKLVYGTGTNCATGPTNMTPAYQIAINGGVVDRGAFAQGLKTASANALCINASAANAVQALVYYAKL